MKAYCDGACRVGNPGETSCAFAVVAHSDDTRAFYMWVLAQGSRYLGLHTNNYAEYQGLLDLLRWATANEKTGIDIYCDSKLVVNQVSGDWKMNSEELAPLRNLAYAMMVRGGHTLHHIKGHDGDPGNEFVDALCNEELDKEFTRRAECQRNQN